VEFQYSRSINAQIKGWLFQNKVIILYGARQVGKTTLCKALLTEYPGSQYFLCEQPVVMETLQSKNIERIMSLFQNSRLIILDEAQKVKDIGQILKLIVDLYPDVQVIATGSSSFDLANQISEPLTGRNIKFNLFPLSLHELSQHYSHVTLHEKLGSFLQFGMYPGIVDEPLSKKITLLDSLSTDYLFKDVLAIDNLRNSDLLKRILLALALQLGNEVSYRELSNLLKTSVETIQRYIHLLELSFVIFRLPSFSRNLRNELAKSNKYYFYDLGIRNSLIQNYNAPESRTDTGALWENFCIMERMKLLQAMNIKANFFFWRTYQQKEIDFIEERDGKLKAVEFKWSIQNVKVPKDFKEAYPEASFQIIDRDNYWQFLTPSQKA
jgi:uncharacterized protein